MNNIPQHILRFIFLILFQGMVLQEVEFGSMAAYITPYLYLLFLLMLPYETPHWLLLLIGFVTGLCIDSFTDTQGMHASACVLFAFCRPYILKLISPREGYEFGMRPVVQDMGFQWYIYYAGIMILIHHIWLFNLEIFNLGEFHISIGKALLSGGVTLLLVLLSQFLILKPKGS